MTSQPGGSAGAVEIRLSGEWPDVETVAALLGAVPALEVVRRTGPRTNRYDPGIRIYVTVRVTSKEVRE